MTDYRTGNMEDKYAKKDLVEEAVFQYAGLLPEKRQGEYTLDDYYALPDDQRFELIDGVLYDMAAPTTTHQVAGFQIAHQMENYIDSQDGDCLVLVSPVDVQLDQDERTMVQPDVVVICDRDKVIHRCIYGAPDLTMEVLSPSTAKKDQVIKTEKYCKAGVREYWMIDIERRRVVVYDFENHSSPVIYGIDQPIPVQIFSGNCQIDFGRIYKKIS